MWIPDSKTPQGIAEVPLTGLAREAFREPVRISGPGPWLFPSDENPAGHQKSLKTVWRLTLRRAKTLYFRIYDLRSIDAARYDTERPNRGVLSRFCHGRSSFGSIWAGGTVSQIQEVV